MRTNELPKLSAYKTWWVIVTPVKGCVRKIDIKRMGGHTQVRTPFHEDRFCACFASKDKALNFIDSPHNLSKQYEARLLTDKQFGDIKVTWLPQGGQEWDIPYTRKQKNEVFIMK